MKSPRAAGMLAAVVFTLIAVAAAVPAAGAEGTRTDGRTGLTWVEDVDFAVRMGFAPQVVTSRVQALRLVAAMNRGEIENFGRRDWRIPTTREVQTRFRRLTANSASADLTAATAGANRWRDLVVAWPVAASATLSGVPGAAVLATNSAHIAKNTTVTGNMVVNDAAAGATLKPGFELVLDRDSDVVGAIAADSLRLDPGAAVTEDASYNNIQNQGSVGGALNTPLALPVFALLPTFHTASPHPGAPDVTVASGQTVVLPAGEYDFLDVAADGRLVLSGGVYDVTGIRLGAAGGCNFPCAELGFSGPADVRVAERLDAGSFSRIGPESGSGVDASEIIFYIAGINGTTGALGATPPASNIGRGSTLQANLYVPNGSVLIGRDSTLAGALLGRDVDIDQGTTLALASYFANRAPIAHPQTVTTQGATPIVITLTGADPEQEDLTFSILTGPTQGSLGPVTPVPPPVETDPEREPGEGAHTAATVTYTPATAGNLEDSFVFQVEDPHGATGMATVRINPPQQEGEDPPPPDTVVVEDFTETTVQDRAVTITLSGDAPAGVGLTFSIAAGTGPNSGSLSTLVQGSESPQRSATTTYTPNSGFLGTDAFDYTACGTIESVEVCDTATATIEVVTATPEPTDLAPDLEAETLADEPVEIALGASGASGASSASAPSRIVVIARPAAFLDGAEIAGNVADSDANGFGDNHNALPGSSPVFISAAVGQVGGGPGSDGTSRIHIEWDISGYSGSFTTARVTLNTHRGTIDSLDTFFFAGNGGNGTLEDTDFEASLEAVGAVMPVPPTSEMPVGADGTFTFDVTGAVNSAIAADADFFTVQGRVDETTVGAFRGLEVRSTASGNVSSMLHPHLELTTPGATPSTAYTITSLPANGTLRDSLGAEITVVPTVLPDQRVSYTPDVEFVGEDSFSYEAQLGAQIDSGFVLVKVLLADCATNPAGCDDGR